MRLVLVLALHAFCLLPMARADAAPQVSIYTWSHYFPESLLERFGAETGIQVVTDFYGSNEELLDNIHAGTGLYDMVVVPDFIAAALIEEQLLHPIEPGEMEGAGNLKPEFASPWYDPGLRFAMPLVWGTTGIYYDTSHVAAGSIEASWKEYFDPRPELAGRVVALDDQNALYRAAAFYLGVDPCTEDPDDAQRILDLLIDQKQKLAFYDVYVDPARAAELLADGTIVLGQMWSGDIVRFRNNFAQSILYLLPREGVEVFADAIVVPSDAPHREAAAVFINWMMEPRNIAELSNFSLVNNTIRGSEDFMEPAVLADPAINPSPEEMSRLRQVKACSKAARELSDKVWARLWPRTKGPKWDEEKAG